MNLTPYIHLSGDWEFPCWEWAKRVYKGERGVLLPELPATREDLDQWQQIELGNERLFDLLVFRNAEHRRHVAICMGGGEMVHYGDSDGVTIERYRTAILLPKIKSGVIYRHV